MARCRRRPAMKWPRRLRKVAKCPRHPRKKARRPKRRLPPPNKSGSTGYRKPRPLAGFLFLQNVFLRVRRRPYSCAMIYLVIVSLVWAFSFGLIGKFLPGISPAWLGWVRLALSALVF